MHKFTFTCAYLDKIYRQKQTNKTTKTFYIHPILATSIYTETIVKLIPV